MAAATLARCDERLSRMAASCILALFALAFLLAAGRRLWRGGVVRDPATRTWLLIAFIFIAVAAWLQWQRHTS